MKPPYSLKKNFLYAIAGFKEIIKENAFKIEISFFVFFTVLLYLLPFELWSKFFLFATLFFPLLAETFNTAIEKIVDLVTNDYHILAKQAKDIAAFGVILSIITTFFIWVAFFLYYFF